MDTTPHDLKLLSIGYYIQGGIAVFYALIMFCYLIFMGAIFAAILNSQPASQQNQIPPGLLPLIGTIVTAFALLGFAGAACLLYAGYALRRNRHRTFILVMAVLNCLAIPYGTVLGIFTFMVLQRPVAKQMFGQLPAVPPPLPAALG